MLPKPSSQLDVMIISLVRQYGYTLECFLYNGLNCMVQDDCLQAILRPSIDLQGSSQSSFFLPFTGHDRGNTLPALAHDLSCSSLKSYATATQKINKLMIWDETKVATSKLKKRSLQLFSRDHRVTRSKASNYSIWKS